MGSVLTAHRLSCSAAYGPSVPWPGTKPASSASQGRIHNHWITRKVPTVNQICSFQAHCTLPQQTGALNLDVSVLVHQLVGHSLWPQGSSIHGILQARLLGWVAISFCRGSFRPRNQTWVSCIAGRFFTVWATREAPSKTGEESMMNKQTLLRCLYHKNPVFLDPPVAQWLRLHIPNAQGWDLIAGWGTRPHMPQPKVPHATTMSRCSQINFFKKIGK